MRLETMRIQLEFPASKVQELKTLMADADIETYKEIFTNALTLLEWAIAEVKAGRSLASVDAAHERYRVLVMPILQNMVKKSQHHHARVIDGRLRS